jgi:hypothetical protein
MDSFNLTMSKEMSDIEHSRLAFKDFSKVILNFTPKLTPKARNWISDPIAMKFIGKYIVHYQDIHSGDYLLLWLQLNDVQQAPEEFRTAKASLLYQKFIKIDAYRYIEFISKEQRDRIAMLLEEGMLENAAPVPKDIFDEILDTTESLLVQRVFKGFYASVFYREYKEAVVLSSNL